MTLLSSKTALRQMMMIAAVANFGCSGCIVKANVISISASTGGIFSAGSPSDLTYTPTSFTGTTSPDGFLDLTNLGQFSLAGSTAPERFNHNRFTLHFDFSAPMGVISSDFVASLSGNLNSNGNGNVHIKFTPNSETIAFATNAGSSTFILGVNDVIGLQPNTIAIASGSITDAADPQIAPATAPETGSIVLFGSALMGYPARFAESLEGRRTSS